MVKPDNVNVALKSMTRGDAGAFAVVVYSNAYAASVQVLNFVRDYVDKTPSVRLIAVNLEEHRQVISSPLLNVTEVPSVLLFFHGKPFGFCMTDVGLIGEALRRLAICSMEVDTFESLGTSFTLLSSTAKEGEVQAFSNPLVTMLDSLYDI